MSQYWSYWRRRQRSRRSASAGRPLRKPRSGGGRAGVDALLDEDRVPDAEDQDRPDLAAVVGVAATVRVQQVQRVRQVEQVAGRRVVDDAPGPVVHDVL